jgi:hypothetical protein
MLGVEISKAESRRLTRERLHISHHVEIPEMFRRDLATDLPVGHRHALRHGCDEIEVPLDQYDRQAATLAQQDQHFSDLFDDGRLNSFRRFVERQQARIACERPRQRKQLLFSTRERAALSRQQRLEAREIAEQTFHRTGSSVRS